MNHTNRLSIIGIVLVYVGISNDFFYKFLGSYAFDTFLEFLMVILAALGGLTLGIAALREIRVTGESGKTISWIAIGISLLLLVGVASDFATQLRSARERQEWINSEETDFKKLLIETERALAECQTIGSGGDFTGDPQRQAEALEFEEESRRPVPSDVTEASDVLMLLEEVSEYLYSYRERNGRFPEVLVIPAGPIEYHSFDNGETYLLRTAFNHSAEAEELLSSYMDIDGDYKGFDCNDDGPEPMLCMVDMSQLHKLMGR